MNSNESDIYYNDPYMINYQPIVIESYLEKENQTLFSIELNQHLNDTKQLLLSENRKIINDSTLLKSRTISINGLCILETDMIVKRQTTGFFRINGPHVKFTFVFDTAATDPVENHNDEIFSVTGKVEMSYNSEGYELILPIPVMKNNYVITIIMSRAYYLQLFKNEMFSHNFDLHKNIVENISYAYDKDDIHINGSIRQLLSKIFNNSFEGLIKRHFVEAKIKGIVSLLHEQELANMTTVNNYADEYIRKLYKARDILNAEYQNPPTISQLARMILLNEQKLKKGFKDVFEITIHNYIIKQRMETAYTLMNEKNMMIFEVAMQLGYKDTSHFINVFKKYFGYTPKYFCKNIRKSIKPLIVISLIIQQLSLSVIKLTDTLVA